MFHVGSFQDTVLKKKKVNKTGQQATEKSARRLFSLQLENKESGQQQRVELFSSIRVVRSVMEERCLAAVGNFTISNIKLGKGAFSRVKLAPQNILGVNVAMKIIMRNRIKDPY
jgi:predicted RNA-binding protein